MDKKTAQDLVETAAGRCWEDSLTAMEAAAFRDPYRFDDLREVFSVMFSLFSERKLKYMGDDWSEGFASGMTSKLDSEKIIDLGDGKERELLDYILDGFDFPNSSYVENLVCNKMAYTAYDFYMSYETRCKTFCRRIETDNLVPIYTFSVRASYSRSWLYAGSDMRKAFDVAAEALYTHRLKNNEDAKVEVFMFPLVRSTMEEENIGRCVSPLWWA